MNIISLRALPGPNIFTHRPVLVMELSLDHLDKRESTDFPSFIDRLLALLPGLGEHYCSRGRPGGFVERLREGVYFGHVVEHVAIELLQLAGIGRNFGRTVSSSRPGVYKVVVEYQAEEASKFLLRNAVGLVETLLRGEACDVDRLIGEARDIVAETELGPSTGAIVNAAISRSIPFIRIGTQSLVQFGYGRHRRMIRATLAETTSAVAVEVAQDKELTKKVLDLAGIPVPKGYSVTTEEELLQAAAELGGPVTVKPTDGSHGRGVSLGLSTSEELLNAFRIAQSYSRKVLVEETYTGRDYRVLVVGGKVVSAVERIPVHVVGDGASTVRRLIERENLNPMRGVGHQKAMTMIEIDEIAEAYMAKHHISLDAYIPGKGELVYLRDSANMSTGATARDVTDLLHGETALMCERAASAVGLDICGIDLKVEDIGKPVTGTNGGIIEVNAAPGIRMHEMPAEGRGRPAGEAILNLLYPPGAPSRIPIISITGTNGKTTITRMVGHVLQKAGYVVGMTTTEGIFIGGTCVKKGDMTGFHSARTVLSDPLVEAAVLETARGGIVRRGLGYDWSDISVMSNIQLDHVGQDDLRSIEDILHVKSLVAERVKEGGTLVLNADDPYLARLENEAHIRRVPKNFVYFSLDGNNPLIRRRAAEGGSVYYVKNGWIVEERHAVEAGIIKVDEIPVTLIGRAHFNISNALAAVAVCRALPVDPGKISLALSEFTGHIHNIGRANLFCTGSNYILLDYGHNPEAFRAVGTMAAATGRNTIAVVGVPGDREDSVIREAAVTAGTFFDSLVLREDADTRGRRRGEVAGLLGGALRAALPGKTFETHLDEADAVRRAVEKLKENDLLVIFYDQMAPALQVLRSKGCRQEECFLEDLFMKSGSTFGGER